MTDKQKFKGSNPALFEYLKIFGMPTVSTWLKGCHYSTVLCFFVVLKNALTLFARRVFEYTWYI